MRTLLQLFGLEPAWRVAGLETQIVCLREQIRSLQDEVEFCKQEAKYYREENKRLSPSAVDLLVEYIGLSNDAAEDGDRGLADDAIVLLLFDDGSGRVMIRKGLADDLEQFEKKFEFHSIDELKSKISDL